MSRHHITHCLLVVCLGAIWALAGRGGSDDSPPLPPPSEGSAMRGAAGGRVDEPGDLRGPVATADQPFPRAVPSGVAGFTTLSAAGPSASH